MANAEGLDMSYKVALNENHGVTLSDGDSIRNVDELSWPFLRSVETLVGITPITRDLSTQYLPTGVTWNVTDAVGASLVSEYIGPRSGTFTQRTKTDGAHVATFQIGPPVYYFANLFKYWRGSICIKIKFVKTTFHTGRLLLVFTPGAGTLTSPTVPQSVYSIRQVLDVRDGNEACIQLPWLLPYNYLPSTSTFGKLDVIVLNQLRAPETCAQSVQMLFYASGGDDFEFALTDMYAGEGNVTPTVFTTEMRLPGDDDLIVEEKIGHSNESRLSTKEMEQSVGEAFVSLKQLLNRSTQLFQAVKDATPGGLQIYPWYSSAVSQTAAGLVEPYCGGDAYNWIAPLYLFYRGNARVAVTSFQTTGVATDVDYLPSNSLITGGWYCGDYSSYPVGPNAVFQINRNTAQSYVTTIPTGASGFVVASAGTGVTSWQVPYSSRYKNSLLCTVKSLNVVAVENSRAQGCLVLDSKGGFTNYVIHRSFDDNFHLSFFLSCPPVLVNAT